MPSRKCSALSPTRRRIEVARRRAYLPPRPEALIARARHRGYRLRAAIGGARRPRRICGVTERLGLVVEGPHGSKAHPAVTAAQSLRICLARILAALRLPAGDQGDASVARRPQRRTGVRGVYELPGA